MLTEKLWEETACFFLCSVSPGMNKVDEAGSCAFSLPGYRHHACLGALGSPKEAPRHRADVVSLPLLPLFMHGWIH